MKLIFLLPQLDPFFWPKKYSGKQIHFWPYMFNTKYFRIPQFWFGLLNLDFECGTPSSACYYSLIFQHTLFIISRLDLLLALLQRFNAKLFVSTFSYIWHICITKSHNTDIYIRYLYHIVKMAGTFLYMVRCHENAYWSKNLSFFAFNIEGYWGQIKKKLKETKSWKFLSISLHLWKCFVLLQGVQKNVK